jgi:hypothetical protein
MPVSLLEILEQFRLYVQNLFDAFLPHRSKLWGDPQLREQLLQMAREWMAAAMHESKACEMPSSH